jgi:hypothetical protein
VFEQCEQFEQCLNRDILEQYEEEIALFLEASTGMMKD